MQLKKALSIGLPLCVVLACGFAPANADEFFATNVNIYPKSVANFKEQIGTLARKGLLSPSQTEQFKTRLDGLERLVKSVESKEWPQSAVADLDKKFASFNADLSTASQVKGATRQDVSSVDSKAKKKDKTPPKGDDKQPGRIDAPFAGASTQAPGTHNATNDSIEPGPKELPDFRTKRRPDVGGGDTKPTGAAGRNE